MVAAVRQNGKFLIRRRKADSLWGGMWELPSIQLNGHKSRKAALAELLSDLPTEEDSLGFAPLVDGLHALLDTNDTKLPLAVALTAPWGGGKTSLMRAIQFALGDLPAPTAPRSTGWRAPP